MATDHQWKEGDRFRLTTEGVCLYGEHRGLIVQFDGCGRSDTNRLYGPTIEKMEFIEPVVVFERGDIVQNKKTAHKVYVVEQMDTAGRFMSLVADKVLMGSRATSYVKVGHIDGY